MAVYSSQVYVRRACLATTDLRVQGLLIRALRKDLPWNWKVLASLPTEDYPPASIAAWIKECNGQSLTDAAKEIMDQWNRTCVKYPAVRLNWGAATKIGMASIKKNVFGGSEFSVWLSSKVQLSKSQKSAAKVMDAEPDFSALPKIAIPKANETAEDWQAAAAKTSELLSKADSAFNEATVFVSYLKDEINKITAKIAKYSGTSGKLAARIPKWTAELNVFQAKLNEVEQKINTASKKFEVGKDAYNTAPATTVAFEAAAQKALLPLIDFILSGTDSAKKMEQLKKLSQAIEEEGQEKGDKTLVKSQAVTAALNLGFLSALWKSLSGWAKGLLDAVDKFENIATLRSF